MVTLYGFIDPEYLKMLREALKKQAEIKFSFEEAKEKGIACGSLLAFELYFKPTNSATMPISLLLNDKIAVHRKRQKQEWSVGISIESLPVHL